MSNTGSRLYKTLLDEEGMRRAISRISHEIIESNKGVRDLVIIGIHTRGVFIAKRITDIINKFEQSDITPNSIDPKNYRDDIKLDIKPEYENPHILIQNKNVILIDDVLYTGRTISASMEALFSTGRPKNIKLATLVDRGHRELPIRPDFIGKNIPTSREEVVKVFLEEEDSKDEVVIINQKQILEK